MKIKYFVYILRNGNDKVYTGYTIDLENRLNQHNDSLSGFTSGKGPWELVWYCAFDDKDIAQSFEKYLKTGSGIAFSRKRLFKYQVK